MSPGGTADIEYVKNFILARRNGKIIYCVVYVVMIYIFETYVGSWNIECSLGEDTLLSFYKDIFMYILGKSQNSYK